MHKKSRRIAKEPIPRRSVPIQSETKNHGVCDGEALFKYPLPMPRFPVGTAAVAAVCVLQRNVGDTVETNLLEPREPIRRRRSEDRKEFRLGETRAAVKSA